MESPGQQAHGSSRRTLLNVLLGGSLAGWLATALFPVLRYLSPLRESHSTNEAELDAKAKQEVEADGYAIVPFGNERVLVLRDRQGHLHALSAKCTHEGCTVQYKADEAIVWCACHNGRYDLSGRVLSGPPPRPLAEFRVTGDLATRVVITSETA
jgi:cytochrome b6-f complex iron-sulfur subunit